MSYALTGDHLTFSQMASTKMACIKGIDTASSWTHSHTGKDVEDFRQQLLLSDAEGKVIARFSAVHAKQTQQTGSGQTPAISPKEIQRSPILENQTSKA